jgi:FkbM family methyltransferase
MNDLIDIFREDTCTALLNERRLKPYEMPFKLIDCRYGRLIYYYYDVFIGSSLELYGEWAQLEIDFICKFLSSGDTVVDVGSFIGTHALSFAGAVGITGKVYAFEPNKFSYYCLSGNIVINNMFTIDAYNIALAVNEGSLEFPCIDIGAIMVPANFGGYRSEKNYDGKRIKMECNNLDNFNLQNCKLIKVDAEGMNLDVLKGSKKTISKYKPFIAVEIEDEDTDLLYDFIRNFDYKIYNFDTDLFNPDNYFKNKKNLFSKLYEGVNLSSDKNSLVCNLTSTAVFCAPKNVDVNLPEIS